MASVISGGETTSSGSSVVYQIVSLRLSNIHNRYLLWSLSNGSVWIGDVWMSLMLNVCCVVLCTAPLATSACYHTTIGTGSWMNSKKYNSLWCLSVVLALSTVSSLFFCEGKIFCSSAHVDNAGIIGNVVFTVVCSTVCLSNMYCYIHYILLPIQHYTGSPLIVLNMFQDSHSCSVHI